MRWHRIRVSIRTQLIALVLMVALFSLLILAIVTGVYFTLTFTQSRVQRLQVLAQLKASQIQQSFIYYYYQCYFLSTRDAIETALSYRRAGNASDNTVNDVIDSIEQVIYASPMFNDARLYDLSLKTVAGVTNYDVASNISSSVMDDLYVLSYNNGTGVPDGLISNGGYIMGPLTSGSSFFISITLPVYTNNSVLISTPLLSGFLSVIVNANSMESTTDTTSSSDYSTVNFIRPAHPFNNLSDITGFSYAFKPDANLSNGDGQRIYNLSQYAPAEDVFQDLKVDGHYTDLTNPFGERVSVGYSTLDMSFVQWLVTVEQSRGKFMGPTVKLTKIIVGACIGIAIIMVVITFPLAHYGVRPIIKLQKATDEITKRRGLKDGKFRRKKRVVIPFHFNEKKGNVGAGGGDGGGSGGGSGENSYPNSKEEYSPPSLSSDGSGDNRNSLIHNLFLKRLNNETKRSSSTNKRPPSIKSSIYHQTAINTNNNGATVMGPMSPTSAIDTNSYNIRDSFNDSGYRYSRQGSLGTQEPQPGATSQESFGDTQSPSNNYHHTLPLPAIVQRKGLFYDELSELTEAFNAMTEELDKQYTHLEDRVRARTKELEEAKIQADSARQQAEDANEAKTVFIANISHELRTPLNGILGMTSIAMAETKMENIQSSLELIFRSGELLLHILTQLLTFSKNQLDKSKLQKTNFQILEVASQVRSIFGKTAKDQNVDLSIIIKPDIIRKMVLFADSNRIIQVIMNLVSNSLKFTPEDGSVSVLIKIIGEYDETRSKESGYEKVYAKNSKYAVGEDAPKIEDTEDNNNDKLATARSSLDVTASIYSSDDIQSIHTLRSSMYKRVLAESYNFGGSNDIRKIDSCDDDGPSDSNPVNGDKISPVVSTLDDDDEGSYNKKHRKYINFKENKTWVLQLSVSDTGTGIDESLQEKIFEAFVQGDQTLSRSYGGTGLGLSICKQFAKMMHGTLTLKSKVGEGSKFTFVIPIPQIGELIIDDSDLKEFYEDEFSESYPKSKKVTFFDSSAVNEALDVNGEGHDTASTPKRKRSVGQQNKVSPDDLSSYFGKPELITRASTGTAHSQMSDRLLRNISGESTATDGSIHAPSDTSSSKPSNPCTILVAEDNMVNQEVIKRMLRLEGYSNVTLACDGNEAIDIVKETQSKGQSFDLIFMDVQMPNIDGLTATRFIRKELNYSGPIVALTAFADKSNEDDCIKAGMSGFLAKPVRRNILKKIINEYCSVCAIPMSPALASTCSSEESSGTTNTEMELPRRSSNSKGTAGPTIDEE